MFLAFLEERSENKTDMTLFYTRNITDIQVQISLALSLFIFVFDLIIGFTFSAALWISKNISPSVFMNLDTAMLAVFFLPLAFQCGGRIFCACTDFCGCIFSFTDEKTRKIRKVQVSCYRIKKYTSRI